MIVLRSIILIVLVASVYSKADEWPAIRGPIGGRASISYTGSEPINEWHYIYKSGRRYKMGLAVWAAPALAVVNGHPMAFIGGYDQTVHAMDLLDKKVIWRKITNGEIANAPTVGKSDGLDVVYWGSADRSVYANVAFSGRSLWTKELIPPSNSQGDCQLSSPFLANGKLFITCFVHDKSLPRNQQKGWLYCLNMRDGSIYWRVKVCPGQMSSPVGVKLNGRLHVIVAARRGIVRCFDVSGRHPAKVWEFQMPHEVLGTPVIRKKDDPLLFLGSKYGNFIAVDVTTGKERWQQMAGNWIDNTACIGTVNGQEIVYVGSHDYNLYAFNADTGELKWKKMLGGEVFSAPCFYEIDNKPFVAAASLDNHLYILDADTGTIETSFFTGNPIWDKVSKGDNLWGSPVAFEAGDESALVYGSFNDIVYVLPLVKECSLTAMARSTASLWWSLLVVFAIFVGVILPVTLMLPKQKRES